MRSSFPLGRCEPASKETYADAPVQEILERRACSAAQRARWEIGVGRNVLDELSLPTDRGTLSGNHQVVASVYKLLHLIYSTCHPERDTFVSSFQDTLSSCMEQLDMEKRHLLLKLIQILFLE